MRRHLILLASRGIPLDILSGFIFRRKIHFHRTAHFRQIFFCFFWLLQAICSRHPVRDRVFFCIFSFIFFVHFFSENVYYLLETTLLYLWSMIMEKHTINQLLFRNTNALLWLPWGWWIIFFNLKNVSCQVNVYWVLALTRLILGLKISAWKITEQKSLNVACKKIEKLNLYIEKNDFLLIPRSYLY